MLPQEMTATITGIAISLLGTMATVAISQTGGGGRLDTPEIFKNMEPSESSATETHENIVINRKTTPSDFAR